MTPSQGIERSAAVLPVSRGMRRVRSIAASCLLVSIAACWSTRAGAADTTPSVTIGVVVDGPWSRNAEVLAMFEREIREVARGEFDVVLPAAARIEADWSAAGVTAALDRLLADPSVDVVIALGVLSSDIACRRGPLPKPTIATAVVDAELQGLPRRDAGSGVRNLAYLNIPSAVERDLRVLSEVAPFEHLAIVVNGYIAEALPSLAGGLRRAGGAGRAAPAIVAAGASARETLAAIPADADAVYLLPLFEFSEAALDTLVAGINARKLPSISSMGEREVRRGVLATVTPDIMPKMARRIGVMVHRILRGEDAGAIPTAFSVGERLVINIETAEAIGAYPSWALLAEADVVGEVRQAPTATLTIESAVREAIVANRSLAAAAHAVAGGAQSVRQARSVLLPQIDASATGLVIDEDRAAASLGSQPERSLSGSATLSQVIFSEAALAGVSIEKKKQIARERDRDQAELDVAAAAATAYINVLRAMTFERIQKENVRLTRDHLDVARAREAVGSGGIADVHRWESQIATDRKEAIEANAQRNLAEIELARILHKPLDTPLHLQDAGLDDTELLAATGAALGYFGNKVAFRALRDFLVEEGLARSPEIAQLDAAIAAARRAHASARRAFWAPTIAAQGAVESEFDASGAGSDPGPLAEAFGPSPDETDWSVALQATYPIFQGGARFADERAAREEAARLEEERLAAVELVEQRIRSALHAAGASYAGIREAETAADAAKKGFDIVSDAYARGAVSLIDLLDAQNAFTVADEAAANAAHDFLLDIIEAQRSLGRFDFMMTAAERGAFEARLDAFMTARGIRTGGRR